DVYKRQVLGTLNVLQAARRAGVGKVIHTSTSEVYGTARYVPIDEKHPLQAQSPYAATKIAADQLALSFFRSFGTPVTVLRPFNTYGPRQSARAVIPTIITQLAAGKREIMLGSTHPTRDFNFVLDTVAGFMAVAESDGVLGEEINLGSNYEISVGELVDVIAGCMGKQAVTACDQQRIRPEKSEVDRLWADNSKAVAITGWAPRYAGRDGLKRGLAKTVEWFTDDRNLAKYRPNDYNL
ncbi:MAG: GDP-mannose 4,6-dehydratase, partial [Negativicutes bacterium]|nr:GDP-mannose 4,6-dehydratase [Negativicutes bacterium]